MENNNVLPECPLTNEELVAKCREWISQLCKTGGRAWTLRIPVDMERDPDILLTEVIRRFEAVRANSNVQKLEEALKICFNALQTYGPHPIIENQVNELLS